MWTEWAAGIEDEDEGRMLVRSANRTNAGRVRGSRRGWALPAAPSFISECDLVLINLRLRQKYFCPLDDLALHPKLSSCFLVESNHIRKLTDCRIVAPGAMVVVNLPSCLRQGSEGSRCGVSSPNAITRQRELTQPSYLINSIPACSHFLLNARPK